MMLASPIAYMAEIDRTDLNRALVAWGHQMGPWERPDYREWRHGLFQNGKLVAVTAAATLIRASVAELSRSDAIELGRLCADRPTLCRVMLRLWREFVFPPICEAHGYSWAISYQDACLHTGATYRNDGWKVIGASSSGTDQRSGRKGRRKVIWGWHLPSRAMVTR
jgi:antitoxin VapB